MDPGDRPAAAIRARDAAAFVLFCLLWLLPITYHGFHGGERMPGFPYPLLHLTNISCLFRVSIAHWYYDYIQVQLGSGAPWVTLEEGDYFRMPAFGHRTRFDEVVRRQLGARSLQELAVWVRHRYRERHAGAAAPVGLRLVSGFFRVGDPIPAGHWRKPPLHSVPADRQEVWYEVRFDAPSAPAPAAPGAAIR